jgi:hypothetical protein
MDPFDRTAQPRLRFVLPNQSMCDNAQTRLRSFHIYCADCHSAEVCDIALHATWIHGNALTVENPVSLDRMPHSIHCERPN